jgi:CYTH domain-containing protein
MYEYSAKCTDVINIDAIDLLLENNITVKATLRGIAQSDDSLTVTNAKEFIKKMILKQEVIVKCKLPIDIKSGKWEVDIYFNDLKNKKTFLNEELIKKGYAKPKP